MTNHPRSPVPDEHQHSVVVAFAALVDNCMEAENACGLAKAIDTIDRLGLTENEWWQQFLQRRGNKAIPQLRKEAGR